LVFDFGNNSIYKAVAVGLLNESSAARQYSSELLDEA
jgi:hypothetical protein